MEDRDIVALYWKRDQQAITSTRKSTAPIAMPLPTTSLQATPIPRSASTTRILAAWNAMPPSKPGILKPFLAKLTRGLSINRYKHRTAQKRGGGQTALVLEELRECASPDGNPEGEAIAASWGMAIRQFVRALPERRGISLCGGTFSPNPCPRRPGAAASAKITHRRSCPARERSSKHT